MSISSRLFRRAVVVPPLLLLATAASPVWAQCDPAVDPVFLAEGPISAVSATPGTAPDGVTTTAGTVTAMGVTIYVPETAPVTSPTATLSMPIFADPQPFPGRNQDGYIGATVISDGCVKFGTDGTPFALAETVFSDVAENVMLGVITGDFVPGAEPGEGTFEVNGTPVSFLTDPRMPAKPITNANGAVVTSASLVAGENVAIEGYYGDDGTLHVWSVEVDVGVLADPNPQITITRYRCRVGDLRVQGAFSLGTPVCTFAAPYSVALFDNLGNPIPFAPAVLTVTDGVAPDPQFCTYAVRVGDNTTCPSPIEVQLLNDGATISSATANL